VKVALKRRVEDSSITTREAVVDLIGTHILQAQAASNQAVAAGGSPTAANDQLDDDYFRFVLGRLNDVGISVRKKVVRILRDLCLQPNPHPRYSELAERLIMCVRDSEESLQSLSVTIVYEMW
jgi:cohesin loading factor subunit SCC2